jgi:hypothetical protein
MLFPKSRHSLVNRECTADVITVQRYNRWTMLVAFFQVPGLVDAINAWVKTRKGSYRLERNVIYRAR